MAQLLFPVVGILLLPVLLRGSQRRVFITNRGHVPVSRRSRLPLTARTGAIIPGRLLAAGWYIIPSARSRMPGSGGSVTRLLSELREGNQEAANQLVPLVYGELRRMAGAYLQRERPGHTLQATALVNEAYIRLVGGEPVQWQNRAHFFAIAAHTMRQVLVEYARRRHAGKRGGVDAWKVDIDAELFIAECKLEDVIDRKSTRLNSSHLGI